jgi:hypothetical protein
MKVCILAVTPAFDKFCIAGMTEDGEWIRPIPSHGNSRFWTEHELTHNKHGFLRTGDVLELNGSTPVKYEFPNHTEDFPVRSLKFYKRLSNEELFDFLNGKEEDQVDLDNTLNANKRSLCLIKVDNFNHYRDDYDPNKVKPKIFLHSENLNVGNIQTNNHRYILKDCKWIPYVLENDLPKGTYGEIYIAIGLATPAPYNGVEYPQIIGIHTNPEISLKSSYPY